MKLGWGKSILYLQTVVRACRNRSSFISATSQPGNTPFNKVDNSGTSSCTSLGIIVLQTDIKRIFYSKSSKVIFSNFSFLFIFPAEINTHFKALRPKS